LLTLKTLKLRLDTITINKPAEGELIDELTLTAQLFIAINKYGYTIARFVGIGISNLLHYLVFVLAPLICVKNLNICYRHSHAPNTFYRTASSPAQIPLHNPKWLSALLNSVSC
jgi:hypothetical protein